MKNVKGAIRIILKADIKEHIYVLGGSRINVKMGLRITLTPKAKFFGMVGGEQKNQLLAHSKGLVFPVLWDEPFGLAITESLYMGAPVFGSEYGSLPELVNSEVGYLSNDENELAKAVKSNHFLAERCHEYARDLFNSNVMAQNYVRYYEQVINGCDLSEL